MSHKGYQLERRQILLNILILVILLHHVDLLDVLLRLRLGHCPAISVSILEGVEFLIVGEARWRPLRSLAVPRFAHLGLFGTGALFGLGARFRLFVVGVEVRHAVQVLLRLYDVQGLVLGGLRAADAEVLAVQRGIH